MPLDDHVIRLAKGANLATVVTLMPDGQPQAQYTWIDSSWISDIDVGGMVGAGEAEFSALATWLARIEPIDW